MFETIVCPLDLKERSYHALPVAADLARKYGSKLILLHVTHKFMDEDEMVMLRISEQHYEEVMKDMAVKAREEIQEAVEKFNLEDVEHETVLRQGSPSKDIPRIAEALGADLIVVSTTGKDPVSQWIIGSTAEAVIKHTGMSVLTVYIDGDES